MTFTRRARIIAGVILCCLAIAGGTRAPQAAETMRSGDSAVVAKVIDGNTVLLETGAELRLSGIEVPKVAEDAAVTSLAEEARAALERATAGRRVTIRFDNAHPDRYGRMAGQLYTADGAWVQGLLLMSGLARVWALSDQRARVIDMLALERDARTKRRGIWSDARYGVRIADWAERYIDSFQLVEGTVRTVSIVRGKAYLNFGPDWHTDFTVMIEPADRKHFRDSGIEPRSYEGRRVRVRGWIKSMNGPMIQASYPDQIEVLAE